MKELQRTLDHDEKLKDFLFHKSNDRAFAADFVEEERDRERKEAEAKDLENTKQFKEAFERIKRVVASDSSLDKIVADFIKVHTTAPSICLDKIFFVLTKSFVLS